LGFKIPSKAIDLLRGELVARTDEEYATETAMANLFDDISQQNQLNGWVKIILESMKSNKRANDIKSWCNDNCSKRWQNWGRIFIFESHCDAVLFRLRW